MTYKEELRQEVSEVLQKYIKHEYLETDSDLKEELKWRLWVLDKVNGEIQNIIWKGV